MTDIVRYYSRLIGLSAVQLTIYERLDTVYETGVKLSGEKHLPS